MCQSCDAESSGSLLPSMGKAASLIFERYAVGYPEFNQYPHVPRRFDDNPQAERAGLVNKAQIQVLRQTFGPIMGQGTTKERAWFKPHRYDTELRRWDESSYAGALPPAVRKRKSHFKRMLATCSAQLSAPSKASTCIELNVPNMASGPDRNRVGFSWENFGAPVHRTCLDQDTQQASAQRLCKDNSSSSASSNPSPYGFRHRKRLLCSGMTASLIIFPMDSLWHTQGA